MLLTATRLIGSPVTSIRAGSPVTQISDLVVDPDKLKIIAFRCLGGLAPAKGANYLSTASIREFSSLGFIIDDISELVEPSDVVRLDEVLKLKFALPGLKVETKKGSKLGKVVNFTVDSADFLVKQIIVRRPALKAIMDPELTISRKEIVEVTDYKIIVKDEEDVLKKKASKEEFVPNFVNPFRNQEPGYAPADTRTLDDKDN